MTICPGRLAGQGRRDGLMCLSPWRAREVEHGGGGTVVLRARICRIRKL